VAATAETDGLLLQSYTRPGLVGLTAMFAGTASSSAPAKVEAIPEVRP